MTFLQHVRLSMLTAILASRLTPRNALYHNSPSHSEHHTITHAVTSCHLDDVQVPLLCESVRKKATAHETLSEGAV